MSDILSVIKSMEDYFGTDRKRINHAMSVLEYARRIMAFENPEDKEIVEIAAVLHDIGIHESERKHHSTAGHYQEMEGPPIAKNILRKLDFNEETISEVCEIIAHHHTPGKVMTNNFQILYEADWLVNLQDDYIDYDIEHKKRLIEKNFKTETGKKLVLEVI